jgi:hypothetical protein
MRARGRDALFWGTHAGAELDLMLISGGKRYGVEFKYAAAPTMTKSLHNALADLGLDAAWIVYPGNDPYRVYERVSVLPLPDAMRTIDETVRGARRSKPKTGSA